MGKTELCRSFWTSRWGGRLLYGEESQKRAHAFPLPLLRLKVSVITHKRGREQPGNLTQPSPSPSDTCSFASPLPCPAVLSSLPYLQNKTFFLPVPCCSDTSKGNNHCSRPARGQSLKSLLSCQEEQGGAGRGCPVCSAARWEVHAPLPGTERPCYMQSYQERV